MQQLARIRSAEDNWSALKTFEQINKGSKIFQVNFIVEHLY